MVGACHWVCTHQLCKTLSLSLITGDTFWEGWVVGFDNRTLIRIAHHIKSHYALAVNQSLKPPSMVSRASFTDSPDYIQSLARGLQVLCAFNRERPRCTLSEIAAQIGLSRAVARRSLLTLQHLGYVAAQGRHFFLTPRVLDLGYSYLSSLDLTELANEAMEQLSQRVGESCSMAVLDGSEIVYVARVAVRRLMSVALGVGARLPAFAASMGRVLLADKSDAELTAWLRENTFRPITAHTVYKTRALQAEILKVRRRGYAFVSQELELGLCSIAVPVRSSTGLAVCGLNVSMRYSDDVQAVALKKMLPALHRARHAIERAVARDGWHPLTVSRSAYG
jgi:IclR family pca regulon transcriptional regulator